MNNILKTIPDDVPGLWQNYVKWLRNKGIEKPRIVIHGGYGKNNTGDDAILHVLIQRIKKNIPKAQITVICHGPKQIRLWYPEVSAYHFRSFATLKAILRSHIYLIGGGGIIDQINTYSGYRRFRIFDMKGKFLFLAALLAKWFGASTHFYAIGATSFPDSAVKLLSRIVLPRADIVSVRDFLSYKKLRSIGINRELIPVLDPALSLEPSTKEEAKEILKTLGISEQIRPLVGLNMRYVRDGVTDNQKIILETIQMVHYLIQEKKCDVLFIPISQNPFKHFEDDLDFGRKVKAGLNPTPHFYLLEQYYHPTLMMAILGEMDFCILERLHAVILAYKMRVPFFVISYDDKVSEFVKLVGQVERMIDLSGFNWKKVCQKIDDELNRIQARTF